MDGFAAAPTRVLETIRGNLLAGLDLVDEHITAGTIDEPFGKAGTPPRQSGQTTRILLDGVDAELARRAAAELPAAILVDVDGTVALRGDRRGPYEEASVGLDEPNEPVIAVVRAMHAAGHLVIYTSARRDAACGSVTALWLDQHVGVPYEALLMRQPREEGVNDAEVKTRIYRQHIEGRYRVVCVLDDRQRVVDAWRALGLTVLQVADGDF